MGKLTLNDFDTKLNPIREDLKEAMSKKDETKSASSEESTEAKGEKSTKTKSKDETKSASSEESTEAK
ncbi:hypothetical protein [Leptospira stimsonii]|uniref:Uncharacterized protein n=1 Tax=Leptospira stimsonii TaxID=2202203 RepID=A0ABY2N5C7_9LEPT|nr:hypothetical protein [Leptospira stimsonii]TGK10359.1 hypothetical protein EHO98_22875 [Leptospira stimsonii]TGM17238.1 hypothetical protein EHQ90_07590 [Leptospira stimsonii]